MLKRTAKNNGIDANILDAISKLEILVNERFKKVIELESSYM